MRRRALATTVACGCAAIAAGCGSGGSTTVVQNSTVTRTVTSPTTTPGSTATGTTSGTATTPTAHLTAFSSPSGNIGCVMTPRQARCDIRERSWKPPPKPATCPLDYGQGVEVSGHGKAILVCAGDTTLGAPKALPYGHSSRIGSLLCTSETSAMKCGNTDNGHGFELSRESYHTF